MGKPPPPVRNRYAIKSKRRTKLDGAPKYLIGAEGGKRAQSYMCSVKTT
jgi:hypothetical protein